MNLSYNYCLKLNSFPLSFYVCVCNVFLVQALFLYLSLARSIYLSLLIKTCYKVHAFQSTSSLCDSFTPHYISYHANAFDCLIQMAIKQILPFKSGMYSVSIALALPLSLAVFFLLLFLISNKPQMWTILHNNNNKLYE